jgi:hypothetical protein
MFIEALAALDPNPRSLLIQPPPGSTLARVTVQYKDAVKAAAAHLYKHMSVTLGRCIRAALAKLQSDYSRRTFKLNAAAAAALTEEHQGITSGQAEDDAPGEDASKDSSIDEKNGSAMEKGADGKKKKADRGGRGQPVAAKQQQQQQQQVPGLDLETSRVEVQQVSGEVQQVCCVASSFTTSTGGGGGVAWASSNVL